MDDASTGGVYEATFCVWTDLSYTECEQLLAKGLKPDELKAILKDTLKLNVAMETSSQLEIAAELYAHGVVFGRRSEFSPIQLSTLVSVLKRVHEACIATPFDNQEETMKLLQDLMVKHCVERPPYSSAVFSLAQVKDITEYILTTYFKHFKLYKYAFTKQVRMDLNFSDKRPLSGSHDACGHTDPSPRDSNGIKLIIVFKLIFL